MEFVADLHTHSMACGHGFSTITEVIRAAADRGLKLVALTEHGPAYPGSVKQVYFNTYRDVPSEMFGIKVLRGCEANIVGLKGELDLDDSCLAQMDLVIASFHGGVTPTGTIAQNTAMYIQAIKHPLVDIIGHPDSPCFPIDIEAVVRAAAEYGVALEINASSPAARPGSEEMCAKIVQLAKQHFAKLTVGSDAHYHPIVGEMEYSKKMILTNGYALKEVLNTDVYKIFAHLKRNGVKNNWR